jgi:hypothetical protein
MYTPELRLEVSQGDIFDAAPLIIPSEETGDNKLTVSVREGRAILLTHDCEYDKPNNPWVLVAEIRVLAEIPSGNHGHIRQYQTRNTFYLEKIGEALPESYVDFRRLTRLPKRLLFSLAEEGKRIASLNDEARLALQRQVAIFFGYGR